MQSFPVHGTDLAANASTLQRQSSMLHHHSMLHRVQYHGDSGRTLPCKGSEPVQWEASTVCRQRTRHSVAAADSCGRGHQHAREWAFMETSVPLCGRANASLRHYDRFSKLQCLDQLARVRGRVNGSYRILFAGVSNMYHIFQAVQQDHLDHMWSPFTDLRGYPCKRSVPTIRHQEFKPHAIDYFKWLVVSPIERSAMNKEVRESCWSRGALSEDGRSGLAWAVEHVAPFWGSPETTGGEPYDVVALQVGNWDASFTERNATRFEFGLERSVGAVRRAWPNTLLILLTLTPCGGEVAMPRNRPPPGKYTSDEACDFVPVVNRIIRRVVDRHAPMAALLDAHQMTTSRPGHRIAGSPPGIWAEQRQGWHFALTLNRGQLREARNHTPPLAWGEMPRAFANRIFDMICPGGELATTATRGG